MMEKNLNSIAENLIVLLVSLIALIFSNGFATATLAERLQSLADAQLAGQTELIAKAAVELSQTDISALGLSPLGHRRFQIDVAEALVDGKAIEQAISLYEKVLTGLVETHQNLPDRLSILKRLAELHLLIGQPEKAAELLRLGIEQAGKSLGDDNPRLGALLALALREGLVGKDLGEDITEAEAYLDQLRQVEDRLKNLAAGSHITMGGGTSEQKTPENAQFELVPVFYGTNRQRADKGRFKLVSRSANDPYNFYGSERSSIETGVVQVSVPRNRVLSEIPKPSVWRLEFRPDPAKHVILEDLKTFPDMDEFLIELRSEVHRSKRQEVFVFIHGYNTDFVEAVERTAQIAADTETDGAAVLFSWPSQGTVWGYFTDRAQIVDPILADLEKFLTLIARESGAKSLHLIAHSMGNEYLVRALQYIANKNRGNIPEFKSVAFAAPDMDAADFKGRVERLGPIANSMSLYASSKDSTLKLSKNVQGGNYRRAGDSDPPLIVSNLNTIDTTPISDSSFGHSDLFGPALSDLQAVMWHGLNTMQRCILQEKSHSNGAYWEFAGAPGGECKHSEFRAAIRLWRRLGEHEKAVQVVENQISQAGQTPVAARWRATLDILNALGLQQ